jgi:hypothetical protein
MPSVPVKIVAFAACVTFQGVHYPGLPAAGSEAHGSDRPRRVERVRFAFPRLRNARPRGAGRPVRRGTLSGASVGWLGVAC